LSLFIPKLKRRLTQPLLETKVKPLEIPEGAVEPMRLPPILLMQRTEARKAIAIEEEFLARLVLKEHSQPEVVDEPAIALPILWRFYRIS